MTRVVVTELSFELPDGFTEQSIAMFGDSEDQKLSRFAIVCTRQALEGRPLEEVLARELESSLSHMNGKILQREPVRLHGLSGLDVRMRTKPSGAPSFLYQRCVAVDWNGVGVMVTTSCAMREREACDRHFEAVLQSIRFRRNR